MTPQQLKMMGLAFLGASAVAFALKLASDRVWRSTIAGRTNVTGVVVRHNTGIALRNNYTLYMPVIEYVVGSQKHVYEASSGSTDPKQYPVGSQQQLFLHPDKPDDVVWAGGSGFHDNTTLLVFFYLFLALGIGAFIVRAFR